MEKISAQNRIVNFHTQRALQYGQAVFVVGNLQELGRWDVSRAVRLDWSVGDHWTQGVALTLPALPSNVKARTNIHIEYKYFVSQEGRQADFQIWDEGENRVIEFNFTTPQERNTLNTMSFNIWYDLNKWEQRQIIAADIIRRSEADLVGFQELKPRHRDDLRRLLPNYNYFGRSRSRQENTDEEMGIMYNSNRFYLVAGEHVWLSRPEKQYEPDFGAFCPRMISIVILKEFGEKGRLIAFLNTHFDHISFEAREASSLILATTTRRLYQQYACDLILVTGDFNMEERSVQMRPFLDNEAVISARNTAIESDADVTTHHEQQGFDFQGRIIIDHIFAVHSPNSLTRAHFTHFKVLRECSNEGVFPSDHFPVFARAELVHHYAQLQEQKALQKLQEKEVQ